MPAHDSMSPSPWVLRFAPLIAAGGRVLDLACGSGRHARLLAERGHRVLALDRDAAALERLAQSLDAAAAGRFEMLQADVEADPWPWPVGEAPFNGIVVTNYLHRPLFPAPCASLRPGGVLIYETFAIGNEQHGRPSNPDFLLARDELLERVAPDLSVLAFEQGLVQHPAPAVVQRICAARTMNWSVLALPGGN
ncbi:MAG: class I SAM-dependent methyltransferase [Betaproteobacteria bacterium]|nr:class I SAM-dependent methyltransferase [Betaproteobacteria bacterium]